MTDVSRDIFVWGENYFEESLSPGSDDVARFISWFCFFGVGFFLSVSLKRSLRLSHHHTSFPRRFGFTTTQRRESVFPFSSLRIESHCPD